jgi:hypothetical protein
VATTSCAEAAVVALKVEVPMGWINHFGINDLAGSEAEVNFLISCFICPEFLVWEEASVMPFRYNQERQFRHPLFALFEFVVLEVFLNFLKSLSASVENLVLFFVQDHPILAFADAVTVE